MPHPPQFPMVELMSCSQPVSGSPSQSARPGPHSGVPASTDDGPVESENSAPPSLDDPRARESGARVPPSAARAAIDVSSIDEDAQASPSKAMEAAGKMCRRVREVRYGGNIGVSLVVVWPPHNGGSRIARCDFYSATLKNTTRSPHAH